MADDRGVVAHRRPSALAAVAVGGAIGTLGRYGVGLWCPASPDSWPVGTFAVNIAGAFVLGLLLEALLRTGADTGRRYLLRLAAGTGMLGAFTTYSTFAVDVVSLVRDGSPVLAASYAAASVLLGLCAAGLGIAVGARIAGGRGCLR
ncbi:fluoride efflux transporter FluC [Rhodococcus sp. NPDC060090]|uniref:fluoride efflux transporter FluC n=1 Tax=Rhodococcus sp. NPDC060090 TaxID=3347056 RepID=UPI00365C8A09